MIKGAIIGTGFWSHYQISAWKELEGVTITAAYNRTISTAKSFAEKFQLSEVYDDAALMLEREKPDFVDIITDAGTHLKFTQLAASKGIHVICQKPMSDTLSSAKLMLECCQTAGVKLFIHENFRWQAPVRAVKKWMNSGIIGKPFKAKVDFCSAFPVFDNQPFLAELDHFILTDIGSHVLDICRYLFGEAKQLYCLTKKINPAIKGEDVAGVFMEMDGNVQCFADMSYASLLEKESFPQTLLLVEGDKGSIQLTHDFELKITTRQGTQKFVVQPAHYGWADPEYAVVHSSIVACNDDILKGLNGGVAETTGEDNLKTVALVWAAYESAASGKVIQL